MSILKKLHSIWWHDIYTHITAVNRNLTMISCVKFLRFLKRSNGVYRRIGKRTGCFPSQDIQTSPPLRSGTLFMKDAHSAESNEKSIIRFFFLVMDDCIYSLRWLTWIFKCVTIQKNNRSKLVEFTGKMYNELKLMKNQFD